MGRGVPVLKDSLPNRSPWTARNGMAFNFICLLRGIFIWFDHTLSQSTVEPLNPLERPHVKDPTPA
jgi:hypothetical protein